tara:strand:- start:111 stop:527 length:417 start_codon:yes stop_codon:yes gene_type:complete
MMLTPETSSTTHQLLACNHGKGGVTLPSFSFFFTTKGISTMEWGDINDIAQIVGLVALPVIGWVFHTVVKHGSKLVMLEEKVNDSIARRLDSLENKVDGIEIKIDNKIDKLEDSLHQTQLTLTEKIIEAIHGKNNKGD